MDKPKITSTDLLTLQEFLSFAFANADDKETILVAQQESGITWNRLKGKRTVLAWVEVLTACYERCDESAPPERLKRLALRLHSPLSRNGFNQ